MRSRSPCSAALWTTGADVERLAAVWSAEEEDRFRAPIRAQYEQQGHPYYATARLWDDGIIDPRDTRTVLGLCLSVIDNQPIEGTRGYGVYRM